MRWDVYFHRKPLGEIFADAAAEAFVLAKQKWPQYLQSELTLVSDESRREQERADEEFYWSGAY